MVKPVPLLAFSVAAVAASAIAPVGKPLLLASGGQCFRASDVSDFRPGVTGVVQVRTEGNRWFELHLSPGCPDIRLLKEIGLRPRESSWLCEGQGDELVADTENRCFVSDIRELPAG